MWIISIERKSSASIKWKSIICTGRVSNLTSLWCPWLASFGARRPSTSRIITGMHPARLRASSAAASPRPLRPHLTQRQYKVALTSHWNKVAWYSVHFRQFRNFKLRQAMLFFSWLIFQTWSSSSTAM